MSPPCQCQVSSVSINKKFIFSSDYDENQYFPVSRIGLLIVKHSLVLCLSLAMALTSLLGWLCFLDAGLCLLFCQVLHVDWFLCSPECILIMKNDHLMCYWLRSKGASAILEDILMFRVISHVRYSSLFKVSLLCWRVRTLWEEFVL